MIGDSCPLCDVTKFDATLVNTDSNQADINKSGYKFTDEQKYIISSLASCMLFVGVVLIGLGILNLVFSYFHFDKYLAGIGRDSALRKADSNATNTTGALVQCASALIQGLLTLILGGLTFSASSAFHRIVDEKGDDIKALMTALGKLWNLYQVEVLLVLFAILGLLYMAFQAKLNL